MEVVYSVFYDQFERLCRQRNIKPTRLARDLGISATAPGRWRDGAEPKMETVKMIADYFGVTTDYLLSDEPLGNSANSNVSSALVQGSPGGNANVGGGEVLQGLEGEMLRVFRGLSKINQAQALSKLYELEAAQDAAKKEGE